MKTNSMGYNRIMAYNVKYNGLTFINNPFFKQEGGILCLKEFSFYEVATSSSSEKYAIRHGEYVSPTMMKNRRIRFLFDILANTEEERRVLLNKVQRAFAPEANPTPFNEKLRKDLEFMDVTGNIRKCKCQIYRGIELSDFANEKRVGISAELITDNSYMKSGQEFSEEITNTQSGNKLPTTLPFPRTYYRFIEYDGSIETPLTVEMQILDGGAENYPYDKIKIVFRNGNDIMQALHIENVNELGMNAGDIIRVDTEKRRCYFINSDGEEDITGLVTIGSTRPVLQNGTNQIGIDVGVWEHVITAQVKRNKVF